MHKTFKDPKSKENITCVFLRVYGIPIWIEPASAKKFKKCAKKSFKITKAADKLNKQLCETKQLLAELNGIISPSTTM